MANLEAFGTNPTVFLRTTTGVDASNDYRIRRDDTSGRLQIAHYNGGYNLRLEVAAGQTSIRDKLIVEGAVPEVQWIDNTGSAEDFRARADANIFYLERDSGAGFSPVLQSRDGFVYANNGFAAGSTSSADVLKWTRHSGNLPGAGITHTVTLATSEKIIGVIGSIKIRNDNWKVHDFWEAAVTNANWYLEYDRATPDTVTMTFGASYHGEPYSLIVLYEP